MLKINRKKYIEVLRDVASKGLKFRQAASKGAGKGEGKGEGAGKGASSKSSKLSVVYANLEVLKFPIWLINNYWTLHDMFEPALKKLKGNAKAKGDDQKKIERLPFKVLHLPLIGLQCSNTLTI